MGLVLIFLDCCHPVYVLVFTESLQACMFFYSDRMLFAYCLRTFREEAKSTTAVLTAEA